MPGGVGWVTALNRHSLPDPVQGADVQGRSHFLCLRPPLTPHFDLFLQLPHEMDAKTWRPGEDHQRQLRRAHGYGREQRVPPDGGLHGRGRPRGHHVTLDSEKLVTVRWEQVEPII